MLFAMFNQLFGRGRRRVKAGARPAGWPAAAYRPHVEFLEDRTVLSAATHLGLMTVGSAVVGQPTEVEVVALDASNQVDPTYTGTIQLNSTDSATTQGSTALPITYTFTSGDHGEHEFSLTPGATGSETITATDTTTSSITGNVALSVQAAPVATHFLLLDGGLSGGGSGNGGGCGGQGFEGGFGSFGFRHHDFGDGGFGSGEFGGDSQRFGSASTQPAVGVSTSVEVIALDASNHIVPNYTGTIQLSSTDSSTTSGGSALPITYTFTTADHGEHTFSVTPGATGTETLTATDVNSSSTTGSIDLNVAAAPVATHVVVQVPRTIVAGQSTPVKVLVLDASNHLVPNFTGTVQLTSSDTAATAAGTALPASYTFAAADNGSHTFNVTFGTTGSQTITATDVADSFTDTVTVQVAATGSTTTTHVGRHHGFR